MSNSFDPDQARHFVGPDMDKKGLISKQPKVVTSRQRANTIVHTFALLKINFQITALKNKETLLIKQLNIKSGLYYFIPIGYQLFNFYTFIP